MDLASTNGIWLGEAAGFDVQLASWIIHSVTELLTTYLLELETGRKDDRHQSIIGPFFLLLRSRDQDRPKSRHHGIQLVRIYRIHCHLNRL